MDDELPDMTLRPIGVVRNEIKQPIRHGWQERVSEVVVDTSLTEALDGIEECSHLIILYWMHRLPTGRVLPLKTHPMGRPELPLVGRFVTRSPSRPNPVGQATVRLLEHRGNILKVRGLDAIDGTPVIDIKPYIPRYDAAADARIPPWVTSEHC